MAYKDFNFHQLAQNFGIKQSTRKLFTQEIVPVMPSAWLMQTLEIAKKMPLRSEKAKSEWLIAPILTEIKMNNEDRIQLFSGEILTADKKQKLNGEIDFILVQSPRSVELTAPIFCLTEAKRGALAEGWAQCAAQLYGARIFNQKEGANHANLYGAVSNGLDWQFLLLENNTLYIDEDTFSIEQLPMLLGVLQTVVNY